MTKNALRVVALAWGTECRICRVAARSNALLGAVCVGLLWLIASIGPAAATNYFAAVMTVVIGGWVIVAPAVLNCERSPSTEDGNNG